MDKEVAKYISSLMLDFSSKLNDSIYIVEEKCNKEDALHYKKSIANIMGNMLIEILNPIYIEHPDLKPEGLD